LHYGISLSLARIPIPRSMKLAALAETNGLSTVSVGEAAHDSFAAATAMAAATSSIRIMTGITTWVRPPVLTATGAATVDEISDGRFTLGLGTMPDHWNRDHYGIDPGHPLQRMEEYVGVIRQTLRAAPGEPIDFAGERFNVRGYRRAAFVGRATLPIVLAATRPAMARLAGRIADGVYFNVIATADGIRADLAPATEKGRAESGNPSRPFERFLLLRASIDDDETLAWERLRESLRMYLGVPYLAHVAATAGYDVAPSIALAQHGRFDEAVAALPMGLVRQMGVAGTVDQCKDQLRRYEGLVDTIVFAPPSGLTADEGVEQITRIVTSGWNRVTAVSVAS
jgi:5,10-methylenetetrahydromethanopterin reductase